ncbi:MAG: GDSL-type esterase/lipase family protein [Spirochaetota bacterium]
MPTPKLENDFYDWYARHEEKKTLVKVHRYDLIFIGDSITHLFEGHIAFKSHGAAVWAEYYGKRNALNLGFGWDRTQNVLWRLANGEFEGQTPKLAVLLIGTNNLSTTPNAHANTPSEICDGIGAITAFMKERSVSTHVLVTGLLPRHTPDSPYRSTIAEINRILQDRFAKEHGFSYIDIGSRFIGERNEIIAERMPDLTHPSESGYREWAEAIETIVEAHVPRKG